MSKKYWVVGSLIALLMVAGFGCGAAPSENESGDERESAGRNGGAADTKENKEASAAILSANDKREITADAKEIALSVFGGEIKLSGIMDTDFLAKGSFTIAYTTPKPAEAGQYDAFIAAFKRAGYRIVDFQSPAAADEDKSGGIAGKKRHKILLVSFEPGTPEIAFTALTNDQYVSLMKEDGGRD